MFPDEILPTPTYAYEWMDPKLTMILRNIKRWIGICLPTCLWHMHALCMHAHISCKMAQILMWILPVMRYPGICACFPVKKSIGGHVQPQVSLNSPAQQTCPAYFGHVQDGVTMNSIKCTLSRRMPFPFRLRKYAICLWTVNSEWMPTPNCISQDGKLPTVTLKWNLHPQREYQFWECMKKDLQLPAKNWTPCFSWITHWIFIVEHWNPRQCVSIDLCDIS